MSHALTYYAPIDRWANGNHVELSWEQEALNAGARRLLAARLRQPHRPIASAHPILTLPAAFAPRPMLQLPAPTGWTH